MSAPAAPTPTPPATVGGVGPGLPGFVKTVLILIVLVGALMLLGGAWAFMVQGSSPSPETVSAAGKERRAETTQRGVPVTVPIAVQGPLAETASEIPLSVLHGPESYSFPELPSAAGEWTKWITVPSDRGPEGLLDLWIMPAPGEEYVAEVGDIYGRVAQVTVPAGGTIGEAFKQQNAHECSGLAKIRLRSTKTGAACRVELRKPAR